MKLTRKEKRACQKFANMLGFTSFRGIRNADYVLFWNKWTSKDYHIDEVMERIGEVEEMEDNAFICKECGQVFPLHAEWADGFCEDCYYKVKNEVEEMMEELCPDAADYDI